MKNTFNPLNRHQLFALADDKRLGSSLKGLLASRSVSSHDIGCFLRSHVGSNIARSKHILCNALDEIKHDPLSDPKTHTYKSILDDLERSDTKEVNILNPTGSSSQRIVDRMFVHQHLTSVGTLLDRVKSAADFLKDKPEYTFNDAKDIISSEMKDLHAKGNTLRATTPTQEQIHSAIVEVYAQNHKVSAERIYMSPMQRKPLDIEQFLPVEDLAKDIVFNHTAPDIVKLPTFTGAILEVDPQKTDIFVPTPIDTADYLGGVDLAVRNPNNKSPTSPDFDSPMLLTDEWAARSIMPKGGNLEPQEVIGNIVVMNCGWFNVFPSGEGDMQTKEHLNPHTSLASFPMVPTVIDGKIIAPHTLADKEQLLDAITFRVSGAVINTSDEMQKNPACYRPIGAEDRSCTINGFKILSENGYIDTPENNKPNSPVSRSGVGIKPNGNVIFVVATTDSRETGITARQFAQFFKEKGCTAAINLDNSGSASMTQIGKVDLYSSNKKAVNTSGSDIARDVSGNILPNKRNRPIPLALIIRHKGVGITT